ncbi:hypothetical protein BABINDRAFT_25951, partial [Babjeviella inositovora NRRL Y-12698]
FENNFPVTKRVKAWERDGATTKEQKDEWFRSKYNYINSPKKQYRDANPDNFKQFAVQRKERAAQSYGARMQEENKERRHNRARGSRDPVSRLQSSPLCDYIYGTQPVLAALKANQRGYLSKLFIYKPQDDSSVAIMKLARSLEVEVEMVNSKHDLNMLTNHAVHNGYVLEAKKLQPPEILKLGPADGETGLFSAAVVRTRESFYNAPAQVTATEDTTQNEEKGGMFPLGLYLDEISDPHNIGAIIRSAYFLGVDFIVMSGKNCASLTPAVGKSSAGALEFMKIYVSNKPMQFFTDSASQGWTFISATTPELAKEDQKKYRDKNPLTAKMLPLNGLREVLENTPVMLVLGSEGTGIRTNLKLKSDFIVQIDSLRAGAAKEANVDSLNVSVAASLLMSK